MRGARNEARGKGTYTRDARRTFTFKFLKLIHKSYFVEASNPPSQERPRTQERRRGACTPNFTQTAIEGENKGKRGDGINGKGEYEEKMNRSES